MAGTVSIAGTGFSVTFKLDELGPDSTVRDALQLALRKNGASEAAVDNLVPVVNGEDAELTDKLSDGAVVTAAPPVSNG